MAYNIIDILDKTITINQKSKKVYLNIDYNGQDKSKFQLVRSVLMKGIEREIKYYEDIKKHLESKNLDEIDFSVYDKISFLINQFNDKIYCQNIDNITNLVNWTACLHKDIFALFISIQGELIRTSKDIETFAYETLSSVIDKKELTIKELERLLIK